MTFPIQFESDDVFVAAGIEDDCDEEDAGEEK